MLIDIQTVVSIQEPSTGCYIANYPLMDRKPLSRFISEYLESIPESGISMLLAGYPVEIIQVQNNVIKIASVKPRLENE